MTIAPVNPFSDVFLIKPLFHYDERGYFSETFRQDKLEEAIGHPINFCQENQSKSSYGTLRGLHYQMPPFAQTKLISAIKGSILDVVVDIRENSPTFSKHITIELNENNKNQLYIPRGFAHGFSVLSEEAIIAYKVDSYYAKEHDRGIAFNDPALNINWEIPINKLLLSDKDQHHPNLNNAELLTGNLYE